MKKKIKISFDKWLDKKDEPLAKKTDIGKKYFAYYHYLNHCDYCHGSLGFVDCDYCHDYDYCLGMGIVD